MLAGMSLANRSFSIVILSSFAVVIALASPAAAKPNGAADTVQVKAGALELQLPKTWKQGTPTSNMRLAEFTIPRAEGDAEDGELVLV